MTKEIQRGITKKILKRDTLVDAIISLTPESAEKELDDTIEGETVHFKITSKWSGSMMERVEIQVTTPGRK